MEKIQEEEKKRSKASIERNKRKINITEYHYFGLRAVLRSGKYP